MIQNLLNITILGLSITSSWGNGHATTFRGLVRELNKEGHKITFLERDVPWYASQRDLPDPQFCQALLYQNLKELKGKYLNYIQEADLVIVGSYVPEGVAVGEIVFKEANGLKAFYDIDTPVTLAKLEKEDYEYLSPEQISRYDLYLSFTGGPTLDLLEQKYGSPAARALYCSVDPNLYYPEKQELQWDLGYLGTYSEDRQPPLENLMLSAACQWREGRFIVAGPQYPETVVLPKNVNYIPHLPPSKHRIFYNSQRYTINITRADMIKAGYSPSVRLFEAAACGVPIISDNWMGLDELFVPGKEILISNSAKETLAFLQDINENERVEIGENARKKILTNHTAAHRSQELLQYYSELQNLFISNPNKYGGSTA
ncbi:glycosyltransferase [soil metagenome]